MPLKEVGMRPFGGPVRCKGVTVLGNQRPHGFLIVNSPRDQDFQAVGESDQSSVEHPMCCARKRQAVADDVRAVLLDRPDMSGVDFGAAAAVYQPEPRYRASFAIGPQDRPAKNAVAYDPR